MDNTSIESYLGIIKAEMVAEYIDTVNREDIQEIVFRAGGNASDVDIVIKHPSVKEIDENMFYIRK